MKRQLLPRGKGAFACGFLFPFCVEGVGRNNPHLVVNDEVARSPSVWRVWVEILTDHLGTLRVCVSPSAWRAWVEISLLHISEHRCRVALHVEGAGRNDGDPMSDEAKECRPP